MSALRGKITALARYDIDGRQIERADRFTAVETVGLVLVADYVDGDLYEIVGKSLAIAPHGTHQHDLAKMVDQRPQREPSRTSLLEVDLDGPPAPTAQGSELVRLRAEVEQLRKLAGDRAGALERRTEFERRRRDVVCDLAELDPIADVDVDLYATARGCRFCTLILDGVRDQHDEACLWRRACEANR